MNKDRLQLATTPRWRLPNNTTNLVPKTLKQNRCMPAFPLHGNLSKAYYYPLNGLSLDHPTVGSADFSCLVPV